MRARLVYCCVAAIIAAAAGYGAASLSSTTRLANAKVEAPGGFVDSSISVNDGQLVLTETSPYCTQDVLDPTTLRPTASVHSSCYSAPEDLEDEGELWINQQLVSSAGDVSIAQSYARETVQTPLSFGVSVRIRRTDPQTGKMSLGPVIMRYSMSSDTQLESVSTGGDLWLYDRATPSGAVLERVSARSGALLQTLRPPAIPDMDRPFLYGDDGALWIGTSADAGSDGNGLYLVAPGAKSASVVHAIGSGSALWMNATEEGLWVGFLPNVTPSACACDDTAIWLFPARDSSTPAELVGQTGSAASYIYTSDGVFGIVDHLARSEQFGDQSLDFYRQEVVRVDLKTGRSTNVGQLGAPVYSPEIRSATLAWYHGYLFALNDGVIYRFNP